MDWQPIETAPADTDVLLARWDEAPWERWLFKVGVAHDTRGGWHTTCTHWMPLPEPPRS
jgi:hypothetical protein